MPKFELPKLPKVDLAKVDVPKPVYAGAGVADLVVETYKEYAENATKKVTEYQKDVTARVSDVQKQVTSFEPKSLQSKAADQFKSISADAKARRSALEARVSSLQAEAKSLPGKATSTYEDLAKRGEAFVAKFRGETPAAPAAPAKKAAPAAKKAPAKRAPAKKAPAKKA